MLKILIIIALVLIGYRLFFRRALIPGWAASYYGPQSAQGAQAP